MLSSIVKILSLIIVMLLLTAMTSTIKDAQETALEAAKNVNQPVINNSTIKEIFDQIDPQLEINIQHDKLAEEGRKKASSNGLMNIVIDTNSQKNAIAPTADITNQASQRAVRNADHINKGECLELGNNKNEKGTCNIVATHELLKPMESVPNTEFNDAVSKLSILNDVKGNGGDPAKIKVLPGKAKSCRHSGYGFSDCCKERGWGQDINFAHCSSEELNLAKMRETGQCIHIGTYCDKRNKLGICEKRKQSFCCFDSKLNRIFNEQGKLQLAKNWGSSKAPICEGFTITEMQHLDFGKMNFAEYFKDLQGQLKLENSDSLQNRIKREFEALKQGGTK